MGWDSRARMIKLGVRLLSSPGLTFANTLRFRYGTYVGPDGPSWQSSPSVGRPVSGTPKALFEWIFFFFEQEWTVIFVC